VGNGDKDGDERSVAEGSTGRRSHRAAMKRAISGTVGSTEPLRLKSRHKEGHKWRIGTARQHS
jgi:hypothetical protein